jgi:uncharacterized protein
LPRFALMTTLSHLRRHAIARSLFAPTTLDQAIARLGFIQADPIRAPARAQDLTLRHRVKGYRAGDLERQYPKLAIEEVYFVNYGFLPRATHALLHPRPNRPAWPKSRQNAAAAVLAFVRANGTVHPRTVDAHFQHGTVTNWFGGASKASTQLLDQMHYRGLLRIAGRDSGTRLYAASEPHCAVEDPHAALDHLIDVIVQKYAPLPERSLSELVSKLRSGAPQWASHCRSALQRAKARLSRTTIDEVVWFWPPTEAPSDAKPAAKRVRLLAPFDPLVWDRRRFELLWGWAYRFEAYVPAAKRVRGHYALPLLWGEHVIGWGNLAVKGASLEADIGYCTGAPPAGAAYQRALAEELDQIRAFLGVERA